MAPADEGAGQEDQAGVEVQVAFPADGQAAELVQQGQGLLDHAAQLAKAFDATPTALGNDRCGAPVAAGITHSGAVIALVDQQHVEASSGTAGPTGDRGYAVEQGDRLRGVVDVAASGNHVQQHATAVAGQVVLAARAAPVERRGPDPGAPVTFLVAPWWGCRPPASA